MSEPLLWHIPVSHYSEKARWALAYKSVEHARRAPPPGLHMAIALWLTRGAHKTFPVLRLEDENIGDSSAIIAALERRFEQPRLFPEDPAELRRALALEDFFDEQLGPRIRLLAWHELRTDAERMAEISRSMMPPPLRDNPRAADLAGRFGSVYVQARFRVAGEDAAADARAGIVAALDRLEAELDRAGGEYLAGGGFSVADLTAASLFYPLANPPGSPTLPEPPARLEEFFAPLRERPGGRWVVDTYARHRAAPARPPVPDRG